MAEPVSGGRLTRVCNRVWFAPADKTHAPANLQSAMDKTWRKKGGSARAGLTHRSCDQFRSTITYGYVNLDNASGQAATFYHTSQYASANLVWQLRKRLSVGLEGLYGIQEARNGVDSGDHWRVQLGMVYSLFD